MATFPLNPKPRISGTKFQKKYGMTKNAFEANYLQVRRTSTRARYVFILDFKAITEAEYATIETFFDVNIGTVFGYIHPQTLVTHQVTFQNDTIEKNPISSALCNTQIILESI